MSSGGEKKGRKRTKAFYRKSAYGGKRSREGANVLEPGIRGFLVMCNSNESIAVKESYNILNEYADNLYGQEQAAGKSSSKNVSSEDDSECEDAEMAMKKEIDSIKNTASTIRRFQNVCTKAKNCVFIRSTVEDPVKVAVSIMKDIAERGLKKARYAARMLPIIGTCKAHTSDIEKLAKDVLHPVFSKDNLNVPNSYTIIFKTRNNNGNTCGKTSVIPALTKVVSDINSSVKFSWSDFEIAVLVEVVCSVCCLGIAPNYARFRKYNLQELALGPKTSGGPEGDVKCKDISTNLEHQNVKTDDKNASNISPEKTDKVDTFNDSTAENTALKQDLVIVLEGNVVVKEQTSQDINTNTSSMELDKNTVKCDILTENSAQEDSNTCKVTELNDTNDNAVPLHDSNC